MLFFVYILLILFKINNYTQQCLWGLYLVLSCHLGPGLMDLMGQLGSKASISVWRAVETQGARPANLETKFDGKNRSNLMLFPGLNRSWNDYEMFKGQLTSGCRNHALGVHHSAEWSWEWSEVWILILHDIAVLLALRHTSQIFDMSNVQLTTAFLLSDHPLWSWQNLFRYSCYLLTVRERILGQLHLVPQDKFLASCSRAHLTNSFVCSTMFFSPASWFLKLSDVKCNLFFQTKRNKQVGSKIRWIFCRMPRLILISRWPLCFSDMFFQHFVWDIWETYRCVDYPKWPAILHNL